MQGVPVNRDDKGLWCGARNLRRRKAESAAVQEVQGQGFDEMKRAQVDKVVSILEDWARWQQAYSVFLGAPRRFAWVRPWRVGGYCGVGRAEPGSGTTGSGAGVVDACVDSLEAPAQRAAIHRRYLSAVYRMRDYEQALCAAHEALLVAFLDKRLLVA
jgi:hypothetical protein